MLRFVLLSIFLSACKTSSHADSNLSQQQGRKSMLFQLQEMVPDPYGTFYGQITNFAAAFHQPILIDPSIQDLLDPSNPQRDQMIQLLIVDKLENPRYACHEMAQDLRIVVGVESEEAYGGFGQAKREEAIQASIRALQSKKPTVISLRHTSRSDDGHSFTLVTTGDGWVDSLEGWASQEPTDIGTGRKHGLRLEQTIEALENIALDPTDPNNDDLRGKGYEYLSQAYGNQSVMYHEQGQQRSIDMYGIPIEPGAEGVSIPSLQMTGVYFDPQQKTFNGVKEGDPIRFSHFTERVDGEIEISARIRSLADLGEVKKRLERRLKGQLETLREYVLK